MAGCQEDGRSRRVRTVCYVMACACVLGPRGASALTAAVATAPPATLSAELGAVLSTRKQEPPVVRDWARLLARPGEEEARSILKVAYDELSVEEEKRARVGRRRAAEGDLSETGPSWWANVFPGRRAGRRTKDDGDGPQDDDHVVTEEHTWDCVKDKLGDAEARVKLEAREASAILARWAASQERGAEYVRRAVVALEYLMATPFGGDGACIAAALLCEAHEAADGQLALEDLEARYPDWVQLLRSLSNVSQLYRLQHARWAAEGESRWASATTATGTVSSDDDDVVVQYGAAPVAAEEEKTAPRPVGGAPALVPLEGANNVFVFDDNDSWRLKTRLPTTHADNLQHMLVAIASDFRALPLLLVRRLRALRFELAELEAKKKRTGFTVESHHAALARPTRAGSSSSNARDALDVLAPLAERFGLYKLKSDLEDAAFERLAPKTRRRILEALDVARDDRVTVLNDVSMQLRRILKEDDVLANSVKSLRVSTREKEPYSVWRKVQSRDAEEAGGTSSLRRGGTPYDTIALRVIIEPAAGVDADALCYHALDLVKGSWAPIPERTKDYIAHPKPNGYQSIHTTALMRLHGQTYPFEVQIRSRKMHLVAEFGSAAHALYSQSKGLLKKTTSTATMTKDQPPLASSSSSSSSDDDKSAPSADAPTPSSSSSPTVPSALEPACIAAPSPSSSSSLSSPFRKPSLSTTTTGPRGHLYDPIDAGGHSFPAAAARGGVYERSSLSSNLPSRGGRRPLSYERDLDSLFDESEEDEDEDEDDEEVEVEVHRGEAEGSGLLTLGVAALGTTRPREAYSGADQREAALGSALGASLGDRLRQERVFVLASGGRVLTVGAKSNAIDVRNALLADIETDARTSGYGAASENHRRSGDGHLEINGERVEWLASLSKKLNTGDEVSWIPNDQ